MPTTCPLCHAPVPAKRRWCPNCGERLIIKRRHPALRIFAYLLTLSLVAVLIAAALTKPAPPPSPTDVFLDANAEIMDPLRAALTGGSFSGSARISADLGSCPLSALLRLASLSVDYDLQNSRLTATASLRLLGATVLTGAFTWSDGYIGVYLPELDPNYYLLPAGAVLRCLTGGLVSSVPDAGTATNYLDLLPASVTPDCLEVTETDTSTVYTCRPSFARDLDLEWTVTREGGATRSLALTVPSYALMVDLPAGDPDSFTVAVEAPDLAATAKFTPSAPPQNDPIPLPDDPVTVPASDVPSLLNRLMGGVSDVL